MLIYTPRPDDTTLVQPNMSLKTEDIKFPKPNFITKNGFYFDNSILEQIELPDGTINFEFKILCIENDYGEHYYNILGQLHNPHSPSVIEPDGTKQWFQNNQRHNPNGPAIIWPDGTEYWYQNDQLHRLDAPAVIRPDGTEHWYQNGQLHRTNGPAVESPNRLKEWYQNGLRHRLDGPAIIRPNDTVEYYINGEQVTKEDLPQG